MTMCAFITNEKWVSAEHEHVFAYLLFIWQTADPVKCIRSKFVKYAAGSEVKSVFCACSVMENLPPVILTDEDLCLEIVEKGE